MRDLRWSVASTRWQLQAAILSCQANQDSSTVGGQETNLDRGKESVSCSILAQFRHVSHGSNQQEKENQIYEEDNSSEP